MMAAFSIFLFFTGVLAHSWALSLSRSGAVVCQTLIVFALALLFCGSTLAMFAYFVFPVDFSSAILILIVYVFFLDAAYSALRFHLEDSEH